MGPGKKLDECGSPVRFSGCVFQRLRQAQAECKKVTAEEARLAERLKQLTAESQEITVSEHALVRYFERVEGYDLAEIQRRLVPAEVREWVDRLGGGTFPVRGHGFRVKVKDRTIVTVLTDDCACAAAGKE